MLPMNQLHIPNNLVPCVELHASNYQPNRPVGERGSCRAWHWLGRSLALPTLALPTLALPTLILPTLTILLLSFTNAFLACPVWSQDKVFPLSGIGVTGKIIERTKDKVVIEVRGANQSFDTHQIARVIFDGEPPQLTRAKDNIVLGQLDDAIAEFQKIPVAGFKSEDIKQDHQFYKGYLLALNALRGKGDAAAASKLLFDWAKLNKTSHLYYRALESLGELAMATGTPDKAVSFFGQLAASSFPELKVKGSYLTGKALLANKQIPEARSKFDTVDKAQLSDKESLKFKKLAGLSLARCDASDGKSPQAVAALEKMVDEGDSTDAELYSELFNALGGIFRAAGNNEEAILAFLKTDLLYASEPDAHAEALYNLSQLWTLIGENQRATETKSRLSKLYQTSPWNKK